MTSQGLLGARCVCSPWLLLYSSLVGSAFFAGHRMAQGTLPSFPATHIPARPCSAGATLPGWKNDSVQCRVEWSAERHLHHPRRPPGRSLPRSEGRAASGGFVHRGCRAYEMYSQRGRSDGHAVDDWLEAERDVLGWGGERNDGSAIAPFHGVHHCSSTTTELHPVLYSCSRRDRQWDVGVPPYQNTLTCVLPTTREPWRVARSDPRPAAGRH
jgi:hypothetical protein